MRAIASSSTLSPRNSSRSYDDARSGAQEEWVKTFSSRSSGRASIRRSSRPRLLVRGDVVDSLTDRLDLLCVLVGNLDPELVFELHDQLDEIERVGVEIFLERGFLVDLAFVDAELLAQHFLHSLVHFLSRICHLTYLAGSGSERAGSNTPLSSRSWRRPRTSRSTPRAARRIAFAIALRPELPCAITARPRRPRRYAPP